MFKWVKIGKIFDPTKVGDRPWLKEFAQAPCTLPFDDFVRVYFSCRPPADENGQYVSYTSYVDFERNDLTKIREVAHSPILSLGDLGMFDEFGIYPTSVIRYEDRVLAYYGGWTRCESVPYNVSIGCAESFDDGVSFQRIGEGPILSFSINEPMTISGPKIRRFKSRWVLFYVAGIRWVQGLVKPESVFKIRVAFSNDGLNWKKLDRDLLPSVLEENECQASPDVVYANGKYHMFFCYKYSFDFRNRERGYRIGYAYSYDLLNWTRDDQKAGITISETGWDSEMVSYPHVFQLEGKWYMMYLGNQVGRGGFGLAELDGDLM